MFIRVSATLLRLQHKQRLLLLQLLQHVLALQKFRNSFVPHRIAFCKTIYLLQVPYMICLGLDLFLCIQMQQASDRNMFTHQKGWQRAAKQNVGRCKHARSLPVTASGVHLDM